MEKYLKEILEELQEIKNEQKLMFRWIITIGLVSAVALGILLKSNFL